MARPSETQYINYERAVVGYGDTQDLALNDLLEQLQPHEGEIGCASSEGEASRPLLLLPPAALTFRIFWRKSTGKIRWKCLWGPGVLEFERARTFESDD